MFITAPICPCARRAMKNQIAADEQERQQVDEQRAEDVARARLVVARDVVLVQRGDVGVGELVDLALRGELLLAVLCVKPSLNAPVILPLDASYLMLVDVVLLDERQEVP